jgi:hypothetical protein
MNEPNEGVLAVVCSKSTSFNHFILHWKAKADVVLLNRALATQHVLSSMGHRNDTTCVGLACSTLLDAIFLGGDGADA